MALGSIYALPNSRGQGLSAFVLKLQNALMGHSSHLLYLFLQGSPWLQGREGLNIQLRRPTPLSASKNFVRKRHCFNWMDRWT
ncbi:hypothetical protein QQP08_006583 [Theobroma cacao]|nr:hypothetical protein QQP08_006583 [Theobroma cacao]